MWTRFHLYENISKVSPFEGPQYYLAPSWAFHLQTLFMGLVFFVGTPLNFIVLLATIKYKKLRVPLNYILVNITLAGFIFVTFAVSQVFVASMRGYYFLGYTLCALEAAMGSIAGKPLGVRTPHCWKKQLMFLCRFKDSTLLEVAGDR